MRILFADSNHFVLHTTLIEAGHTCDLFWDKPASELIDLLPGYDALVIRSKFKITNALIDNCPRLKCIGRVGAGMENIDLTHAKSKGIVCLSAPEGNRDAVGEHALGMLLMLLNHLKKADNEVRQGIWLRAENRGYELAGKAVGIIGYGNMGSSFAKKLSGFDCRVLAFDKYKSGFGNSFVNEVSLQTIFEESDIVSIHLPLNPETEFIVNQDFLNRFRKNIYVVNTSRGKNLKTDDLVAAIQSGKVLGACLDVLEYETISFERIEQAQLPDAFKFLAGSDKVVLSPHIAGWTHESNYKMSRLIAEKMLEALSSKN